MFCCETASDQSLAVSPEQQKTLPHCTKLLRCLNSVQLVAAVYLESNEPMKHVLAIALGGALGAVCRHLVNQLCSRSNFPWATLVVNVVGCFLIGLLITLRATDASRWGEVTHSALAIGFLGALTTFSTFGFETNYLFSSQQHGLGLLNIAGNMLLGLLAVYGGIEIARWMS